MSKWIAIFAIDIVVSNDDGKVLLFDSEEAAIAGGVAEYGEDCRQYVSAQECADAV